MSGNSILPGQIDGPFTLTISFSIPVNNIYIGNSAMGYNLYPGQQECFTVNSNQGTPTLTLVGGCYDYGPVGNQVCGSYQGGNTGGNIQVSTPTPYTELTITGTGIGNLVGYAFDLCFPSCITTTTTSSSSSTTTTTTTSAACAVCVGPPTVVIGTQTWTTCNLDVTTYRDGTPIPEVTDPTAWAALTTGAWCYYNNTSSNGTTYGKLYNWYAVKDPRGLAPVGYHIPSDAEWTTLGTYLGGEGASGVAGGAMKEVGFCHWDSPNTGATNSSNFAGLPAGFRWYDGSFYNINIQGIFWSSTELSPPYTALAYTRYLYYTNVYSWRGNGNKEIGYSVRLLVGEGPPPTTSTTTTLAPSGFNTIYTHFEAL
jgi:uncharacterized protein (TIGR02145 family)